MFRLVSHKGRPFRPNKKANKQNKTKKQAKLV